MCFSATANFVGGAILGGIGIATLAEVEDRRELLFAALPCLFAFHQLTEGFVWLGLEHRLSPLVTHNVSAAYVLFAQGLLPFLLPLGVMLIEPTSSRRKRMSGFLALGGLLSLYTIWGLIAYPLKTYALYHTIVYQNDITTTTTVAVVYVAATCGALFFSGFRQLVVLGAINLFGLLMVMLLRRYAFTSLWCAYAAIVSVLIYLFFRSRNSNGSASGQRRPIW